MTHTLHGSYRCNPRTLATVCAAIIDQKCLPEGFGRASAARFAIEHLAASLPKYAALFPTEENAWRYLMKIGMVDEDLPERKRKHVTQEETKAVLDVMQEPTIDISELPPPAAPKSTDESKVVLEMMKQLDSPS